MSRFHFYFSILLLTLISSCGGSTTPKVETPETEKIVAPDFSADSAFSFVQKQVDFGPRVPNTPEHDACGQWLASELERFGADVIVQKARARAFDGKLLELQNIIGQFNPKSRSRILLYAHWDTRPFADKDSIRMDIPIDGANDGGSGVGVLLEIARQLRIKPAEIGVDIIFFDGEDYGKPNGIQSMQEDYLEWCLGSQYWSNEPHRYGYRARFGILLDMVGAKNAEFNKEGFFVSEFGGIPSANIVDYRMNIRPMGYGFFHHTHADNMDIIDKNVLEEVGVTVLSVVYSEQ